MSGSHIDELAALYGSAELAPTREHQEAIAEVVNLVLELVPCEEAFAFLWSPDKELLTVRDGKGERGEIAATDAGAVVRVCRSQRAEVVADPLAEPGWAVAAGRFLGSGPAAIAPIAVRQGDQDLGALVAVGGLRSAFLAEDLLLLTSLAERAALAIENIDLRSRMLREDRELEFVSMLAHELSGPMTTIKGFGNTLRGQWDSLTVERRNRFLDIVTNEIDRLSQLADDLLDVARMESGALRYELRPFDLTDLVHSILDRHPSLEATHKIVLEADRRLPEAIGDRDRIRQVFLNLVSNATRYSPEGTIITISLTARAGEIEVSVRDEGIGIAEEDLDRVFSKFVMLPKPTWVGKGTGLGLFITKGIVEAHGGRIWIESRPGEGSTFRFTLRSAGAEAASPRSDGASG